RMTSQPFTTYVGGSTSERRLRGLLPVACRRGGPGIAVSSTAMNPGVTPETLLGAGLKFDNTVPRSLVHKLAVEEVLICDYKQIAADDYAFAAQLPRCHSYLSDVCVPYYDIINLGEALRQAALLLGHTFLGVA